MPWWACGVLCSGAEPRSCHITWAPTSTPLVCACVPGFHTYQRVIGCELLKDGNSRGFLQCAYDGQDFIIFNKDALSSTAVGNVVRITRRARTASRHELQCQKNWLENECITWLKRFLECRKDTLQRTGKGKGEYLVLAPSAPWVLYTFLYSRLWSPYSEILVRWTIVVYHPQ